MEIPFKHSQLEPTTWSEVMGRWQNDEIHRAEMSTVWKERGYRTWEEWRLHRSHLLGLPDREWVHVHVDEPSEAVPQWWGGPFQTWIDKYYADHALSEQFSTLVQHPEVASKKRIRDVMKDYPAVAQLVGLIWHNRVLVFEGMHRSCALALSVAEGHPIATDLSIALTDISDVTEERLRQVAATTRKE